MKKNSIQQLPLEKLIKKIEIKKQKKQNFLQLEFKVFLKKKTKHKTIHFAK